MSAPMNLQPTWSYEEFVADLTDVLHGPQWFWRYWLVKGSGCKSFKMASKKWTK